MERGHPNPFSPGRAFLLLIARLSLLAAGVGAVVLTLALGDVDDSTAESMIKLELSSEVVSIRFAVIGDYGQAGQLEEDVANLVKGWGPDFIITTGDNNYDYGEASTIDANIGQYYHEFIYPYLGSYGPGAAENRFFPSLGNHDWYTPNAQPYLDYFTLPGNERYYNFSWGPVDFHALDSDSNEPDGIAFDSTQGLWLQTQLAASSAPWKIVYFHHAPYSSGPHGSIATMQWPFEAWGATSVLVGHDHDYERITVGRIPYFVNGSGGKSLYSFGTPISGSQVRYNKEFGAMLVDATTDEITFQFIDRTGELIDRFSQSKAIDPAPVDFNMDVVSEVVIFRSGAWRFFDYDTKSFDNGVWTGSFPGCSPVPMDYDGDGGDEFTQFCDGAWHFYHDDGSYNKGIWTGGIAGDLPVPADYDGDGTEDVVVWSGGAWRFFDFTTKDLTGSVWTGSPAHWLGGTNIPVPMDYDGDGAAEFTVFSGGPWHFYNDDGAYNRGIWTGGVVGDLPVPADYDGDVKEEVVVWRAGAWRFFDFDTRTFDQGVWTGAPPHWRGGSSLPAPLDVDGDGAVDFSVYAGGPWHFYDDGGTYVKGIWTGAVLGDQGLSRRILP